VADAPGTFLEILSFRLPRVAICRCTVLPSPSPFSSGGLSPWIGIPSTTTKHVKVTKWKK